MSTLPSMSVLIPAYNAADTIGDALESVVAQSPPPFEIIVSDDGSEDDLDTAIAPFRERVQVVRGPNAGLATARNRAAAVATGDVLALLDADDVWLPGRGHAIAEAARTEPDVDIVTTDAFMVRDGEREPATYYEVRGWPQGDQRDAIVRSNFIFGAAAIRRSAFEAVGGYDPRARYAEDWDLWLRLLASGRRAALVDEPLYEYRRRSGSLTDRRVDLAVGVIAVLTRARSLPFDAARIETLEHTIAEWRVKAARDASLAGDGRARRLAARAVVTPHVPVRRRVRALARVVTG